MRWTVVDPMGLVHVIEYDNTGKWHGENNLGHVIVDSIERARTVNVLLRYILQDPEVGEWKNYSWAKSSE